MNNQLFTFSTSILLIFFLGLMACTPYSSIIVEYDNVKSTKRIRTSFHHYNDLEINTPFRSNKQNLIKEIGKDEQLILSVFEEIEMELNSAPLEDTIYWIIDEKIFPIELNSQTNSVHRSISENKENILTADSTNVKVVTGHSQSASHQIHITYELYEELVNLILPAQIIQIRYYSSPYMMTTQFSNASRERLKKFLIKS